MMKTKVITAFIFLSLMIKAQIPWQWANASVGYGGAGGTYIDAGGNIYSTGSFGPGNIAFGTTTLTATGITNMFIRKHDASGNLLWAKTKDGVSDDYGGRIMPDASGNIYVTGSFISANVVFGTYTLTNTGNANNKEEIFIVKYDPQGNVLWAKSFGGVADDGAVFCFDASSNMFLTGYFNSQTIAFGTTTLTNTSSSGTTGDLFIAKYDAAGNFLWAKSAGGTANEGGSGCVDASGNLVVTGSFQSPAITFGNTTLTNAGNSDIFIVKYDPSGNVLWAKKAGGTSAEAAGSGFDSNGDLIVSGFFQSPSIIFGATTLYNTGSNNTADIFIVKYDGSGNLMWAKSMGGTGMDMGGGTMDANGNIFISGTFTSPSLVLGTTTLTNAAANGLSADLYVAKLNTSGNVLWAQSVGGSGQDYGGATCDAFGNLVLSGTFRSPAIAFDNTMLSNNAGNNPDNTIIFLAKLSSAITGIAEETDLKDITLFPNPFSDHAILQSDVFIRNGTLTITNDLGQRVKQVNNISGKEIVIPRDDLAAGVYLVHVADGNQTGLTIKMVVAD